MLRWSVAGVLLLSRHELRCAQRCPQQPLCNFYLLSSQRWPALCTHTPNHLGQSTTKQFLLLHCLPFTYRTAKDVQLTDGAISEDFTLVDGSLEASLGKIEAGSSIEHTYVVVPNKGSFGLRFEPAAVTYIAELDSNDKQASAGCLGWWGRAAGAAHACSCVPVVDQAPRGKERCYVCGGLQTSGTTLASCMFVALQVKSSRACRACGGAVYVGVCACRAERADVHVTCSRHMCRQRADSSPQTLACALQSTKSSIPGIYIQTPVEQIQYYMIVAVSVLMPLYIASREDTHTLGAWYHLCFALIQRMLLCIISPAVHRCSQPTHMCTQTHRVSLDMDTVLAQ